MVSSCDLAKGVAFLDLVRYDPAGVFGVRSPFAEEGLWIQILGGLVGVEGILVGKEVVGVVVRDAQDVGFAASGDHVLDVLWVEVSQFFHRNPHKLVYLFEMQVPADLEGVDLGRHPHVRRHQSVLLAVPDRVHGSDEGRDVAPCLPRKVVVDRPEVPFTAVPSDGLDDVAGTAVVGGDGKAPVSEHVVGVGKVTCRRVGGFDRVKSLVHVGVDLKTVKFRGPEHELPHTLRTGPGDRHGIQGGLDDGHVLKLVREVVLAEGLFENRHVVLAEPENRAHLGGHLLRVQHHVVAYCLVVGESDE